MELTGNLLVFKVLKVAWKNTYKNVVTVWERWREGGREGKKGEGREEIYSIILHVPMMLANIDIRLPWFMNIKCSIKQKP